MSDFKKIIFPILGVIAFIIVLGVISRKSQGLTPFPFQSTKKIPAPITKTVKIDDISINATLAQTESEREKGLSGKDSLNKNSGMLFVLGSSNTNPTFWMKDMKFPIDIIWIKGGKITQIDKNAQVPSMGTPDSKLQTYSPGTWVDYVLEVNSSFSDQNGIKVGDNVLIE